MSRILIATPPLGRVGETLTDDLLVAAHAAGHELIIYAPFESPDKPGKVASDLRVASYAAELSNEELAGIDLAIDLHDNGPGNWRELKDSVLYVISTVLPNVPILTVCNSSSATDAATLCPQPANLIGFATVRPFAAVKLVELLLPLQANPHPEQKLDPVQAAIDFFQSLGKETVQVADGVGGVLPRMVAMIVNEAAYALQEGVASAQDIDTAMRLGANYPYGPLAWADLLGLDIVHATLWALQQEFGDDRYRPCALLTRMVQAGMRGKASGQGFYRYE